MTTGRKCGQSGPPGLFRPGRFEWDRSGRTRRDGTQFALAGAVDRLRACRSLPQPGDDPAATGGGTVVLAATDPASPWGLALPWPTPEGAATPRRAAGATVVAVDGHLVLFVDSGGRTVLSFGSVHDPERARAAVQALQAHLGAHDLKGLRVEKLDGVAAAQAPSAAALVAAGFHRGSGELSLDAGV